MVSPCRTVQFKVYKMVSLSNIGPEMENIGQKRKIGTFECS